MHGNVIQAWFKQPKECGTIDSWELTAARPEFLETVATADQQLLEQLEALGYWKSTESNVSRHINAELEYNLAVSYLDGGKADEAITTSKNAYAHFEELRFALIFLQLWVQQPTIHAPPVTAGFPSAYVATHPDRCLPRLRRCVATARVAP